MIKKKVLTRSSLKYNKIFPVSPISSRDKPGSRKRSLLGSFRDDMDEDVNTTDIAYSEMANNIDTVVLSNVISPDLPDRGRITNTLIRSSPDFRHQAEWLANLEADFETIIIGGLDVSLRDKTEQNIQNNIQLTPKQNNGVVHALNYHVLKQFGRSRPRPDLCRSLAELLKRKIPGTYKVLATVETADYGLLPVKRRIGEGGNSTDLATRIGDNFFNKFIRPSTTNADLAVVADVMLDLSAKKKTRKNYGLNPDKYQLATKISKADFQASEAAFKVMKEDDSLDIQAKFRTSEPSSHVLSLKAFWAMPDGPKLLNAWFQWITDTENDLVVKVEENLEDCLLMAQKVLIHKKGAQWEKKLHNIEASAEEDNGNQTMVYIFILRELAESFKNKLEKAIFCEGMDDVQKLSSQPFIHIVKVDQLGEDDYAEAIKMSVRIGTTVIFDNITLAQGLASIIQFMFCFNLLYPTDCDDFFEYVQRVVCKFGPISGARNARGQLKKSFMDFQCILGGIMLESKKGKIKELII